MSKYARLGDFLRDQTSDEVSLTFADIERISGTPLPPRAQLNRAWWSNNPANNVMTKVWLDAGFKTERVDIESRRLIFRRMTRDDQHLAVGPGFRFAAGTGRAWVAPGIDLTEPADPEWGAAPEDMPVSNDERVASGKGRREGNRHPLFGAHRGLLRVTPGTELTQPVLGESGDDE